MAEIKIEKKTIIWPWVLLGLIIVALAAYFLFFKDNNSNVAPLTNEDDSTAIHNHADHAEDAVGDYVMFIEKDTANMSLSHEYSHDALTKLANATEETANNNNVDISENLSKVKALADKITQNEQSTTHADDIKESARIIGSALTSIQQAKFPDLSAEVSKVMTDANDIDVKDLTLDQKGTVKGFFKSAKDVIKKMNNY
ncbi:hypothetical protein [Pedobacter arcticus]|uniref:hypothetical protein n=1 Tax=Pedobacter arcticus TaxID=752140 RepID=UPI000304CD8A|nr:hypothetical protein [Pedobacter arcticus]